MTREEEILTQGQALTNEQLDDARKAGVKFPENIRLKFVDTIPDARE